MRWFFLIVLKLLSIGGALLLALGGSSVQAGSVAVLLSADVDAYRDAIRGFKETTTHQIVAESIETLQFAFNLVDGSNPSPVNQSNVPDKDTESEIRAVNIYLGSRSAEAGRGGKYIRSNAKTQVALRSMAYFNNYQ